MLLKIKQLPEGFHIRQDLTGWDWMHHVPVYYPTKNAALERIKEVQEAVWINWPTSNYYLYNEKTDSVVAYPFTELFD